MAAPRNQAGMLPLDLPEGVQPPTVAELVDRAMFDRRVELGVRKALGPGPVYQGVAKQIRRLTATGKHRDEPQLVDPLVHAGTIAAARQLARAIDKHTGHNPSGWVSSGRDLSPLFEQLRELMTQLAEAAGSAGKSDPFLDWLNDDEAPAEPAGSELP